METMPKNLLMGAMAAAGIMAVLCVLDFVMKVPFGGRMELDIPFLIASGLILYMGWDTYRELN